LASGADPRVVTSASLSSSFLTLNAFYYLQKRKNNYRKLSAFASSALLQLFFTLNCSFCWWGAQECFLP